MELQDGPEKVERHSHRSRILDPALEVQGKVKMSYCPV